MAAESDSRFASFDAYDFAGDPKFCVGWENIQKTLHTAQPEVRATKLLEAKVFYYSKFFEPINVSDYRNYMTEKQLTAPQELGPPGSHRENKENEEEEEDGHLSFSEVMERVERGEKLPGVEDLNIEPTHTEVTQSQCNRVKKPWEN